MYDTHFESTKHDMLARDHTVLPVTYMFNLESVRHTISHME